VKGQTEADQEKTRQDVDLTSYIVLNNNYYELVGIIQHIGQYPTSGHYVAWIKSGSGWFVYDDERCHFVNKPTRHLPEFLRRNASGVLYRKCGKRAAIIDEMEILSPLEPFLEEKDKAAWNCVCYSDMCFSKTIIPDEVEQEAEGNHKADEEENGKESAEESDLDEVDSDDPSGDSDYEGDAPLTK
jgi:hypothetical protein